MTSPVSFALQDLIFFTPPGPALSLPYSFPLPWTEAASWLTRGSGMEPETQVDFGFAKENKEH